MVFVFFFSGAVHVSSGGGKGHLKEFRAFILLMLKIPIISVLGVMQDFILRPSRQQEPQSWHRLFQGFMQESHVRNGSLRLVVAAISMRMKSKHDYTPPKITWKSAKVTCAHHYHHQLPCEDLPKCIICRAAIVGCLLE